MDIILQLKDLQASALRALETSTTPEALDQWMYAFLGRKGKYASIVKAIPQLSDREKPAAGRLANEVKRMLEDSLRARREKLDEGNVSELPADVTWPGEEVHRGHLHPMTQFTRKVRTIFVSMGFDVIEGPEVELTKYNFDLLNIPKDHPARDRWDTFFVQAPAKTATTRDSDLVLRTHTSPMQIRVMENRKPPTRFIVPGRVFRHEATDASHEATFYQCEGVVIDKGIRVTDLIGTLEAFIKELFGSAVKTRVRPEYYPFVEPGMDIDMSCLLCGGKGCSACKQTGWMEMLGSGMVHPTVLKNMHVNPNVYSGFAFGMGLDRLMMLYYGIHDVRLVHSGDLRFLEQF